MEWGFWEQMYLSRLEGGTMAFLERLRRPVTWYSVSLEATYFRLLTLGAFLGWSLLAVHRLMRAELQVKQWPWAWLAFTLFVIFYHNGFLLAHCAACGESLFWPAFLGFAIAVAGAYLALFLEAKDVVRLRGLRSALGAGAWGRALTLTPTWLPAAGLAGLLGVLTIVQSDTVPSIVWVEKLEDFMVDPDRSFFVAGVLSVLAFLMRDFALIVGLNLGERRKRADLAALVYLLVLYGLIPVTLKTAELDLGLVGVLALRPEPSLAQPGSRRRPSRHRHRLHGLALGPPPGDAAGAQARGGVVSKSACDTQIGPLGTGKGRHDGLRLRPDGDRRRLGRSARGAHGGPNRRAGGDRRGVPLWRHLRDPGLRAEEASGLCQPLSRGLRGCRRLWLGGPRSQL